MDDFLQASRNALAEAAKNARAEAFKEAAAIARNFDEAHKQIGELIAREIEKREWPETWNLPRAAA